MCPSLTGNKLLGFQTETYSADPLGALTKGLRFPLFLLSKTMPLKNALLFQSPFSEALIQSPPGSIAKGLIYNAAIMRLVLYQLRGKRGIVALSLRLKLCFVAAKTLRQCLALRKDFANGSALEHCGTRIIEHRAKTSKIPSDRRVKTPPKSAASAPAQDKKTRKWWTTPAKATPTS